MRPVAVRHLARTLTGFGVVAAALFAWRGTLVPPRAEGPATGAAAFATHCARCHEAEAFAARFADATARAAAVAELVAFLHSHGAANDDEDQAIAQWLAQRPR